MDQLNIILFDPLQVILKDAIVSDFRTQKVVALLVYLATDPDTAHKRETLMALLWPGMPDSSARTNLRQVLFHLRKAMPDFMVDEETAVSLLITNRHTIQLNPDAPITIDAVQFESLLQQTQTHNHLNLLTCTDCHENLLAAATLYTGNFLADFYLEDSDDFQEWAEIQRQRYQRKMLDALETLTAIGLHQQAYAEARLHAERQLEIDGLREKAYQQLMEILARNGQQNEALAVYQKCSHLLREELGMAPTNRTTELYERIQAGDIRLDSGQGQTQGVRGYELRDEIGSGAYGVIHRAVQPTVGREVAVKIIHRRYANDPAFIRRFEAEAQTIARLEHPHIVPLYDYWRDPDGAYLVMRLLRGGDLLTALTKGAWDLERTQKLLDQITPALAAAHQHGIIHRDIKPANILFDESGNAYLSDFGIAKNLRSDNQFTMEGGILGTPDYISPEQLQDVQVSPQSDIYSLGAVLYEVLTGEKPFPDQPLMTVIQNHLTAPFPLVCETRTDISPQVDHVIQKATAKRPSDRFPDALAMAEAFRQSLTGQFETAVFIEPTIIDADIVNPYKGLRAFQEADAVDFHGRISLTNQLIKKLSDSRFLAVVGPSGSGKSSVVKAGMIPALRQGAIAGSSKWFVAEMVPGTHPLEELELALWPIAVNPPPSLVEPMQIDPRGMLRTIRRIMPNEDGAQLLLIIDQFEELWSLTPEDRRQHFLESLLAAIAAPNSPLRVIVTLRADFYDRPLQYQPIAQLFKQHTELVLPLTRDELSWAIQEPARRVGVDFEESVLTAIVAEVDEQPGALPLLQYALTELFEARNGRLISRRAYDEMGGVLGALPRRADDIFDHLSASEKTAARQFFLRLITLGEGVEDTRRRGLLSELEALNLESEQNMDGQSLVAAIVNRFGDARLLTFDHDPLTRQPTVEVAHEALLREWGQLRHWLDESRDDMRLQRLLATAVSEWHNASENPGYLLREARLIQYEGWATTTSVALTADEHAFLAASATARTQRHAEEEARQQRELATAQRLAETEHARAEEQMAATQNLRRRAAYLGVALVFAAILAVAALFAGVQARNSAETAVAQEAIAVDAQAEAIAQAEEAQNNANIAATAEANAEEERAIAQENEAVAIAAQADALAQTEIAQFNEAQAQSLVLTSGARDVHTGGNVDLALALAMQAVDIEQPPAEAVRILNDVAYAPGTRLIYENEDGDPVMNLVDELSDDSHLITRDSGHTLTVWDPNSHEMLNQFDTANEDATFRRLVNIPNSTNIATSYTSNEVIIWDWLTGEKVQTLPDIDMTNVGSMFSTSDGETLITTVYKGVSETEIDGVPEGFSLTGWDIESGEQVYHIDGAHGERFTWNMATPDNEILLIVGSILDNLTKESQLFVDGDYITGENRLLIIEAKTGEILGEPPITQLNGNNYIRSIAINSTSDQAFAIIADADGASTGVFLSLPAGEVVATAALDKNAQWARHSPDGSQVVVGINTNSASYFTLLDAMTGETIRDLGSRTDGHTQGTHANAIAFTPDGKRLVAGDDGGGMVVWDVETGELTQRLFGHNGERITHVIVSSDGNTAITTGGGLLRFWDITQNAAAQVFEAHETEGIYKVAISPDGTKAISTGIFGENEAILWDTSTFEVIHRLPGIFLTATFLPDGQSAILGGDSAVNVDYPEMLLVHWDIESGEVLNRQERADIAIAYDIALSPDGNSFYIASFWTHMFQFDIETFTEIRHFPLPDEDETLYSVAISPDGQSALAGGDAGDIVLFNLDTTEVIRRYPQGSTTQGLAFSANGKRFVSGSSDQTLALWDVATGEVIQTFYGHADFVVNAAFTPDESQIVSASADGTLILWDVATGEALRTFSEHSAWINTVTLSPDGQLAYSGADDGTVIVRPIALSVDEILAHIAENRASYAFTCVERKQYRIFPLCDADGSVPNSDN